MQKHRTERLLYRIVCFVIKAELNRAIVNAQEENNYEYDADTKNYKLKVDILTPLLNIRFTPDLTFCFNKVAGYINIYAKVGSKQQEVKIPLDNNILLYYGDDPFGDHRDYKVGENGLLIVNKS